MNDFLKNKRISDDELKKISGGNDGNGMSESNKGEWRVFCKGIEPVIPRCGWEQYTTDKRVAQLVKYQNKGRCQNCGGNLDIEAL